MDASNKPRIIDGDLDAPAIEMADKIAGAIRGRAFRPPSTLPCYTRDG